MCHRYEVALYFINNNACLSHIDKNLLASQVAVHYGNVAFFCKRYLEPCFFSYYDRSKSIFLDFLPLGYIYMMYSVKTRYP